MRVRRALIVVASCSLAFGSMFGAASGVPRASLVLQSPVSGTTDVLALGDAAFEGSTVATVGNAEIVGMARQSRIGYWLAAADGGVYAYGRAHFFGSMGGRTLHAPIVGIAATPSGLGYWLVASDGGVFAFGDAGFHGSTGALRLDKPIVGIAATRTGKGYWLAASDGGVFAFGDARFRGSMGGIKLVSPVVDVAAAPTGQGYWLAAADGGVFAFGVAGFFGSQGGQRLEQPIVALDATRTGAGYWLVAADGGVFTFGNARFLGSGFESAVTHPVVDLVATPSGNGYWLAGSGTVRVVFVRGEQLGVAVRDARGPNAMANAVRALLAGPNRTDRRAGLRTTIPTGTKLLGLHTSGHTVTVNLDGTYITGGGSLSMQLRVAEVVYTLTGFPGITKVAFEIDGNLVETIGAEGVLVNPPVGRTDFESFLPSVYVEYPSPGEVYAAPGIVTGAINAFEGTGIFELRDANGVLLARSSGMGEMGVWRPFSSVLDFTTTAANTATGTLSAIPSTGREIPLPPDAVIPVRFR